MIGCGLCWEGKKSVAALKEAEVALELTHGTVGSGRSAGSSRDGRSFLRISQLDTSKTFLNHAPRCDFLCSTLFDTILLGSTFLMSELLTATTLKPEVSIAHSPMINENCRCSAHTPSLAVDIGEDVALGLPKSIRAPGLLPGAGRPIPTPTGLPAGLPTGVVAISSGTFIPEK